MTRLLCLILYGNFTSTIYFFFYLRVEKVKTSMDGQLLLSITQMVNGGAESGSQDKVVGLVLYSSLFLFFCLV